MNAPLRLTWVQPEDLIGHELRQAAEDGRDATDVRARWLAAGGHESPPRAGASPTPADPALRALAESLLDELATRPSPLTPHEPTDLPTIRSLSPAWRTPHPPQAPGGSPAVPAPPATQAESPAWARPPVATGHAGAPASAGGWGRELSGTAWQASASNGAGGAVATVTADPAGHPARGKAPATGPAGPQHPPGTAAAPTAPPEPSSLAKPPGAPGLTKAVPQAQAPEDAGGTRTAVASRSEPTGGRAGPQGPGAGRGAVVCPHHSGAVQPESRGDLVARLEAGWLGRAAGCLLGKPVEKLPLDGIREIARGTGNWPLRTWFTGVGLDPEIAARYPWNRRSAPTSLAENISGMPEDDDLNYPLLGLLLLEAHGHGFRTADVAGTWLAELPAGRTFTAERVAYRNLLDGVEPPLTAARRNPFREWIGALIRADVYGWTHPGDPAGAAEAAWRDAVLSHTANGVYGAMFAAAVVAAAAGGGVDVHGCLAAGLSVVPPGSRLAAAVRFGTAAARAEPSGTPEGFADVVDALHAEYGGHHWVHVLPNTALLAAALTHAGGDFAGAITRAVSGGWDTDSTGATAGSVAGLLAGSPAALPACWTAPLRNRLATTVGGLDGIGFDTLARRTAALAATARKGSS